MTCKETRLERAILRLTRYARHKPDCALSTLVEAGIEVTTGVASLCTCGLTGAKSEFSEAFVEADLETRERMTRSPD